MPVPGLVAVSECSSTHPLKTDPKPPSPNTLSGRKFLVAVLSSRKVKVFKFEDCRISHSLRGVWGTETNETLLLELLRPFPSLLPYFEFKPVNKRRIVWILKAWSLENCCLIRIRFENLLKSIDGIHPDYYNLSKQKPYMQIYFELKMLKPMSPVNLWTC